MNIDGRVKLRVLLRSMSVHIHSSEENNVMKLGWPHSCIQIKCDVYIKGKRTPIGGWIDEDICLDIESEEELAKVIKKKSWADSIEMPEGAFKTYQRMVQLANMHYRLYAEDQEERGM